MSKQAKKAAVEQLPKRIGEHGRRPTIIRSRPADTIVLRPSAPGPARAEQSNGDVVVTRDVVVTEREEPTKTTWGIVSSEGAFRRSHE